MTSIPLPHFTYQGVVLDYSGLSYNPCNDLIFPSVIHAGNCLPDAPAPWLMYYAPHDAPGGICLAIADELAGPWREYGDQPLIAKDWAPHYNVSHVCSPHAVWNPGEEKLFLYFHGENSTTRFATSSDGIHFEYGGIAITEEAYPKTTGAFYARVFHCRENPPERRWMMFLMGHYFANDEAVIFAAQSATGRTWEPIAEPVARPGRNFSLCSPWLTRVADRNLLLCHRDSPMGCGGDRFHPFTDIVAYELDSGYRNARELGIVLAHNQVAPDNNRCSDPCLIEADGKLWLFHTIGSRLGQKISVATADG